MGSEFWILTCMNCMTAYIKSIYLFPIHIHKGKIKFPYSSECYFHFISYVCRICEPIPSKIRKTKTNLQSNHHKEMYFFASWLYIELRNNNYILEKSIIIRHVLCMWQSYPLISHENTNLNWPIIFYCKKLDEECFPDWNEKFVNYGLSCSIFNFNDPFAKQLNNVKRLLWGLFGSGP